jgi:hypothetical protein
MEPYSLEATPTEVPKEYTKDVEIDNDIAVEGSKDDTEDIMSFEHEAHASQGFLSMSWTEQKHTLDVPLKRLAH